VLPGVVLVAAGMGPGFAVGAIAATSEVVPAEQGAAAALLATSTQVGAAVGVALLGVLAAAETDPAAGTRTAFLAMAVAAAVAAACALAIPARVAGHPPPATAHAAGCRPGCP
jgi:MFS family permease